MPTRKEMIEFIAMCDKKPVSQVENFLTGKSAIQIKPLYDQMKEKRDFLLQEITAIAV